MMAAPILSQANPSADVWATLYTCTASMATISSITVCNTGDTTAQFSVRVTKTGAEATAQYVYHQQTLRPHTNFTFTLGITLGTGHAVKVLATTDSIAFNIFGIEDTL